MKKAFSEFYRPTDKEFDRLWANCIFVFDANVLLNLYRYPQKTTRKLLPIIESVKERVWLPYQAGEEYQRNRLKVINEQKEAYGLVNGLIDKTLEKLMSEIKQYSRHPFLDGENICSKVLDAKQKLITELSKVEDTHPDWETKDYIRRKLDKIFSNRVGECFTEDELIEIYKEGEARFKKEIPPGFKDKDKDSTDPTETKKYGDFVIWKEILRYANNVKKPIIFITDDQKDDWWWKVAGKNMGPRHELIKEIRNFANVDFYMYESAQFMRYAGNLNKDDEVIEDIKKIQKNYIYFQDKAGKIQYFLLNKDSHNDNISGNIVGFKNFGTGETDESTEDDGNNLLQ
ncbi:MAG: PIN domain-containing protein [Candidatus Pacebacteria bacterium]|jgi:hypothetical protein|nr:PIN domain-containing protein [Candidatus Paceibacterota bacterium]